MPPLVSRIPLSDSRHLRVALHGAVRQLEDAVDIASRNGVDLTGTRKALEAVIADAVAVETTLVNELRRAAERAARARPVRASLVIDAKGESVPVTKPEAISHPDSRSGLTAPRRSSMELARSTSSTGRGVPEASAEPGYED